jgi:hypothetical protein
MLDKARNMSRKRTIICTCGFTLCVLWGYFAAPTFQSRGVVLNRDWFNPGVLLGWVVIWLVCGAVLLRARER